MPEHSPVVAPSSHKPQSVVHSNAVTRACYQLSTIEIRVLLSAMAKMRNADLQKGASSLPEILYVNASDLIDLGSDPDSIYSQMRAAARSLRGRFFTILNPDPDDSTIYKEEINWFLKVSYGEGKIGFQFSPLVIPLITELKKRFTKYNIREIGGLSFYAVRLYEICCQYRDTGWVTIPIAELRDIFVLGDKYSGFGKFKERVIDSAISQINSSDDTDFCISYEPKKGNKGKAYTHLEFSIHPKFVEPVLIKLSRIRAKTYATKLINSDFWHQFYEYTARPLGLDLQGCQLPECITRTANFLQKNGIPEKVMPWLKKVGFRVSKKDKTENQEKSAESKTSTLFEDVTPMQPRSSVPTDHDDPDIPF